MSQSFPKEERFGLTSQMRRCAVSIPSNIAEGAERGGAAFRQFLGYAAGSTSELETQLDLARQLDLADTDRIARTAASANEVRRMLWSLIER